MANNNNSELLALSRVMQRWAELCSQQLERELSPELMWYLKGRREAHAMDAERARAMADPVIIRKPPKADPFMGAYKATLELISGLVSGDEGGEDDHPREA